MESDSMFTAQGVEQICWDLQLAEYPRGLNRARILNLANGGPPYPLDEAEQSGREVNVNDLTMTRIMHEARSQLYLAHTKPGNYCTLETDMGVAQRRAERSHVATKEANRIFRRSDPYNEHMLSKFGAMVLHGRGPYCWTTSYRWRPKAVHISDVLIPGNALRSMENLPFFAIHHSMTVPEMKRQTRNEGKGSRWNMEMVKSLVEWVDEQTCKLQGGTTWSEFWKPEKREERLKSDSGLYSSDLVPTIDYYDFYFWDDAGGREGWRRRMVLDAEGGRSGWTDKPGADSWGKRKTAPGKNLLKQKKSQFLFTSGNMPVACNLNEILQFQFADLSADSPYRYHSVRGLGWMLFAACHLQNRLRCALAEAGFETLLQYFRVASSDEVEQALSFNLIDRGIVPENLRWVSPAERWQPNYQLAGLVLGEQKEVIRTNSAGYIQDTNMSRDRVEKTKFQVMAELQALQSLTNSALMMSTRYAGNEYREDVRRLMNRHSSDPDVQEFRARCVERGVPEKMLVPDAWETTPERMLGAGNRTLEMAIAQQLMEWRTAYAAESQEKIVRYATLALMDDVDKAYDLVPPKPQVSGDKHAGMIAFGSLMAGGKVEFTADTNLLAVAETLVGELGVVVGVAVKGGVPTSLERVQGMQNVLAHIGQAVAQLSKDKAIRDRTVALARASGKIANMVKKLEQHAIAKLQAEAENAGQNGEAAKLQAKLQADQIAAQAKAETMRESRVERAAQRQAEWENEERRKDMAAVNELQRQGAKTEAEIMTGILESRADMAVKRNKSESNSDD